MIEKENKVPNTKIGKQLKTNPLFKTGEIFLMFFLAFIIIKLIIPLVGDNPLFKQLVVGGVNIILIIYIWTGLIIRGDSWKDFGLTFKSISWSESFKRFLLSLLVLLGTAAVTVFLYIRQREALP